jgi:hypothetical protein
MTLVEMLMSVGIGSVVIAAAAELTLFSAETMTALGNYDDLNSTSRQTLDFMTQQIRQADHMVSFTTNQLVFQNLNGSMFSYTYRPSTGALILTNGGSSGIMLSNIDYLTFSIYQRNPSNNFTFYSASSASQAKLIQVNWECSRKIFGQKLNTETVQTAKIVVRN